MCLAFKTSRCHKNLDGEKSNVVEEEDLFFVISSSFEDGSELIEQQDRENTCCCSSKHGRLKILMLRRLAEGFEKA